MNHFALKAVLLPMLLQAAVAVGVLGISADAIAEEPSASNNASSEASATLSNDPAEELRDLTVPSGTQLRIEVSRRKRLRLGGEVQARLLEPIYAENRMLIPSGALLHGTIVELRPAARDKRLNAQLQGDFTPLREPVIQWTLLTRADGTAYPLSGESSTGAGGTLYFRTEAPPRTSFVRRAWNTTMGRKSPPPSDEVPRKGERLQRYLWSQLPLHPQYLESGARYEMALTEDMHVAARPLPDTFDLSHPRPLEQSVWVYSRLRTPLNSATAKPGDPVEAIVTEPIYDEQNRLLVPQNSILQGKVLYAEPSGPRGRNGTLRFAFHQVNWPSGFAQKVEAAPAAIESNPEARMSIDQEGGVARENQHSFAAPLLTGLLSGSTLGDSDAGRGKITAASNGFAILGRVAGLASGSPFVGGSIGAVSTARLIHKHWLAHGKETCFTSQTEVVLKMSPAHAYPAEPEKLSAREPAKLSAQK